MVGNFSAFDIEMRRHLHISYSFGGTGGAGISAATRNGLRLSANPFDWKRSLVRKLMRLMSLPMDVSAGIVGFGLKRKIKMLRPNRVFIHWIGNEMLRYEELNCLKCVPVTIVLHDFTLFEHPSYREETWFDRWRLKRIRKVLSGLQLDFEAPSEWAAKHIKELFPNAIVTIRRTPVRKEFYLKRSAKENSTFKLLFGCQCGRANPYKGFASLEFALSLLPSNVRCQMELHLFGEMADESQIAGVKTIFHGEVTDVDQLARLYRSCDALAFPSICETQGLVKDEALACGLKVICFDRTACPEGIVHLKNGYIAKDISDFSEGLKWAFENSRGVGAFL